MNTYTSQFYFNTIIMFPKSAYIQNKGRRIISLVNFYSQIKSLYFYFKHINAIFQIG